MWGGGTEAGGVRVNHIAKWDGSSWSALGQGVDGMVHALVFDSTGNLYVGGNFTEAGGLDNIAKWGDGSSWSALGNARITDLALDADGRPYVSRDGKQLLIENITNNSRVTAELQTPPRTLTIDFSGNHAKAKSQGNIRTGVYWIELDGGVYRTWVLPDAHTVGEPP